MEGWLALRGAVVSVDANTLVVVQTSSGDQVTRVGFYEGDDPSMSSGHGFELYFPLTFYQSWVGNFAKLW